MCGAPSPFWPLCLPCCCVSDSANAKQQKTPYPHQRNRKQPQQKPHRNMPLGELIPREVAYVQGKMLGERA